MTFAFTWPEWTVRSFKLCSPTATTRASCLAKRKMRAGRGSGCGTNEDQNATRRTSAPRFGAGRPFNLDDVSNGPPRREPTRPLAGSRPLPRGPASQ